MGGAYLSSHRPATTSLLIVDGGRGPPPPFRLYYSGELWELWADHLKREIRHRKKINSARFFVFFFTLCTRLI
jgi:hypothetical protein